MGGARRHAHRAVVTAFITIHAANTGIAWPCQLRNRYEFVTKVSRSGSSEEMGCEHRVRIAHLDGTLFFLRNGALVVRSRRHSLEGRRHRASLSFIARSVLGPNGTRFTSARRRMFALDGILTGPLEK